MAEQSELELEVRLRIFQFNLVQFRATQGLHQREAEKEAVLKHTKILAQQQ